MVRVGRCVRGAAAGTEAVRTRPIAGARVLGKRSVQPAGSRLDELLHGDVALALRGGLGRVRDATGLLEAAIFEARLRGGGWLDRPLSPAGRQALANLMYLRSDLGRVREQPAREIWAAIDRILVEDGLDPLPPQAVLRLQDGIYTRGASAQGLPVSPIRRWSGQHTFIEFIESHSQSRFRDGFGHTSRVEQSGMVISEYRFSDESRRTVKGTERTLGLFVEWHRGIGHRTQLDAQGSVRTPVKGDDLQALYRGSASWSYFIADRWLVTASAFHEWLDRDRTTGPTPRDQSQTHVNLQARYFLENRVSVALGLSHRDRWIRESYGTAGAGNFYDRTTGLTFQLDYRLMGRLSAPGFEISRDAPPAATTPL